jgi:hypothetical protein
MDFEGCGESFCQQFPIRSCAFDSSAEISSALGENKSGTWPFLAKSFIYIYQSKSLPVQVHFTRKKNPFEYNVTVYLHSEELSLTSVSWLKNFGILRMWIYFVLKADITIVMTGSYISIPMFLLRNFSLRF